MAEIFFFYIYIFFFLYIGLKRHFNYFVLLFDIQYVECKLYIYIGHKTLDAVRICHF